MLVGCRNVLNSGSQGTVMRLMVVFRYYNVFGCCSPGCRNALSSGSPGSVLGWIVLVGRRNEPNSCCGVP